MEKLVSIIMGVYNCESTLKDSIESIINQTYHEWELIMCDDGSCDNTYKIAYEYSLQDKRIKLIQNVKNEGLAKSLNNCLAITKGEYIARHDGDDIMLADRIEKQVKYMNTYKCDACGSGAYIFDDSGIWGIRRPNTIPTKDCMITGAPFIHPTIIIKRDVLLSVGGYTVNSLTRRRLEDYDLWIKLFEKKYILHNIDEPLIYFREDKNSYNRKKKKFRISEIKARIDACKRLKITYLKRVLLIKYIILIVVPHFLLKIYHINRASKRLENI